MADRFIRSSATHEHIAGVAVAQRKAGVGNQVGQAVSAAQQALLGVPASGTRQVDKSDETWGEFTGEKRKHVGGWAAAATAATAADAAAAAERLFQPSPHSITQWSNHSCHSAANCEASITAAAAAAGVAWASLVEARLGAGNGGLQRQGGGRALLVLRQRGDRGSIGKLADSLQQASAARVVWLLCCNSRRLRWPGWATEISTTSQPNAGLAVQPASTAAARSIAACMVPAAAYAQLQGL